MSLSWRVKPKFKKFCVNCGKEFESEFDNALYCNDVDCQSAKDTREKEKRKRKEFKNLLKDIIIHNV